MEIKNTSPTILGELVLLSRVSQGDYVAAARLISFRCDVPLEAAMSLTLPQFVEILTKLTTFYNKTVNLSTSQTEDSQPASDDTDTLDWLRKQFGEEGPSAD